MRTLNSSIDGFEVAIENGLADQSKGVATCASSSAKSKPIVGNASRNGNCPSERQAERQNPRQARTDRVNPKRSRKNLPWPYSIRLRSIVLNERYA